MTSGDGDERRYSFREEEKGTSGGKTRSGSLSAARAICMLSTATAQQGLTDWLTGHGQLSFAE